MLAYAPARLLSAAQHPSKPPFNPVYKYVAHLLVQMKYEDDRRKQDRRNDDGQRHPWNPLPRSQIQFSSPVVTLYRRVDHHFRVRDDSLHIDIMLISVFRRPYKEIFNVVVRAPQSKIDVRREK